jgi:hypothetical protein
MGLAGHGRGSGWTHPELAVVQDGLLIILLDVVGEVVDGDVVMFDVLHDLDTCHQPQLHPRRCWELTLFLNATSSDGVRLSDLPMTGMTFTRGASRRINSISSSRRLVLLVSPSLNYQFG